MKKRLLILLVAACTSVASGQPRTLADTLIVHVIGGFGVGGNQSQLLWLKSNGTYQMLSSTRFAEGYHWSIMQSEYALDVVFRRAEDLHPLYEEISRPDGPLFARV
jgi:hypothetical protein